MKVNSIFLASFLYFFGLIQMWFQSCKMAQSFPFEWIDIPEDELKTCMPEAEGPFIR